MKNYLLILLIFCTLRTVACDCPTLQVDKAFRTYDLVIEGKVINTEYKNFVVDQEFKDSAQIELKRLYLHDTLSYWQYTIEILTPYKLDKKSTHIIIKSGIKSSRCDWKFNSGEKYVFYAIKNINVKNYYPGNENEIFYLTSLCSRTTGSTTSEKNLLEEYLEPLKIRD